MAAVGEGERDEPRGAEAAPARQGRQPHPPHRQPPQRKTDVRKTRRSPPVRSRHQQQQQWREAAATTARFFRPVKAEHQTDTAAVFRAETRALTLPATAPQEFYQAADEIGQQIIPPGMDDLERGYGDERSAIMQDFARRLAGATTASERRVIKDQRKSAMAAAREKAKRRKEGRRAAFTAARQNAPRRQKRQHHEPGR